MTTRAQISTLVAVVLSAFLVGGASATESTIYPGIGIGKVKIGMTANQVNKVLGSDRLVVKHETYRGARYIEYGWGTFTAWTVTFRQRGATLRAVQVGYALRDQRTTSKIGVGSTLQQVARAYPYAVCGYYALLIVAPNGVQTVFTLNGRHPHPTGKPAPLDHEFRVLQVAVRQPFKPQPEFAHRCRDHWLELNNPTPG